MILSLTVNRRRRRHLLLVAIGLLLATTGCSRFVVAPKTMASLNLSTEVAGQRCLMVLLPGALDTPEKFTRQRFNTIAAEHGPPLDLVAADARVAYYRKRQVIDRLERDVMMPLRAGRPRETWLTGVSIGGLGALLYFFQHPQQVDGLFLVAPFLGPKTVLREINAAGGVRAWQPPLEIAPDDYGRQLWRFLKAWDAGGQNPPIYLGYGLQDDPEGERVLAEILPRERLFERPGGHDWPVWRELWRDFLGTEALAGCR